MPELSDKDSLPGYPEGAHSIEPKGDDQSLSARKPTQFSPGVAGMSSEASGYAYTKARFPSADATAVIPKVAESGGRGFGMADYSNGQKPPVGPPITTVDCGACNFTAASPDGDRAEMMFRAHFENDGCHATEEYADPTWHQSIAMALMEWAKPILPAYVITICAALIFFLFYPEYIPWTK